MRRQHAPPCRAALRVVALCAAYAAADASLSGTTAAHLLSASSVSATATHESAHPAAAGTPSGGLSWKQVEWRAPGSARYAYAYDIVQAGDDTPAAGTAHAGSSSAAALVRHVFYCANTQDGVIRDSAVMRRAVGHRSPSGDVAWTYEPNETVAVPHSADPDAWDHEHVCDPDVVASRGDGFGLGEERYQWALFYTGIHDDADRNGNSVGLALSHSLDGPWVKRDGPLIEGRGKWGAGQPSAVTLANNTVLVVFTRGDSDGTRLASVVLDLSDAQAPVTTRAEANVTMAGLTRADGSPDTVSSNAAIAIAADTLWAVRDGHPMPSGVPAFISDNVQLASLPLGALWAQHRNTGDDAVAAAWTVVPPRALRAPSTNRTHNVGVVTNAYGQLVDVSRVEALVTTATAGAWPQALWSYRPVALDVNVASAD